MSLLEKISLLHIHLGVVFVVKFLFSVALLVIAFVEGWHAPASDFVMSAAVFGLITLFLDMVALNFCSPASGKAFSVTMQACSFAATLAILCMFMLQWTSDALSEKDAAALPPMAMTQNLAPHAPVRTITPVTISITLSLKFAVDCHALIVGVWRLIKEAVKFEDDADDAESPAQPASGGL